MDRNFEAIAIVATAASTAGLPSTWPDISQTVRGEIVEAVLATARNLGRKIRNASNDEFELVTLPDFIVPRPFTNAVEAALTMYDGNGAFAIEEISRLGEFMINDAGYEPEDKTDSIVDSVIDFIRANVFDRGEKGNDPGAGEPTGTYRNEAMQLREEARYARRDALDTATKANPEGATAAQILGDAVKFKDWLLGEDGPITREEIVRRGVDETGEGTALDVIDKLGWPTRDNPLGINPTHALVPLAALPGAVPPDWPAGGSTPLYQVRGPDLADLQELLADIAGHDSVDTEALQPRLDNALAVLREARFNRDGGPLDVEPANEAETVQ